jgi:hypothetical protein
MNKEVANSYFPLYRAELYEYFNGDVEKVSDANKVELLVKANLYEKVDVDSEWSLVIGTDMDDMMVAAAYISLVYHSIKKDGTVVDSDIAGLGVSGREISSIFPFRKIDVQEFVYGRDSGSPWSDPENDIRQSLRVTYYLQKAINGEWERDYDDSFGSFAYAMVGSIRTMVRLIEHIPYEFSAYNTNADDSKIAMFEYNNHLFKFTYHIPDQKCVCGDAITDYWNDYDEDTSIKVDYLESYVFLYDFGQVLVFHKKLYMNAEFMITLDNLEKKYGITYSNVEWGDKNFKEWLKKGYPDAKSVSTFMSWYTVR